MQIGMKRGDLGGALEASLRHVRSAGVDQDAETKDGALVVRYTHSGTPHITRCRYRAHIHIGGERMAIGGKTRTQMAIRPTLKLPFRNCAETGKKRELPIGVLRPQSLTVPVLSKIIGQSIDINEGEVKGKR